MDLQALFDLATLTQTDFLLIALLSVSFANFILTWANRKGKPTKKKLTRQEKQLVREINAIPKTSKPPKQPFSIRKKKQSATETDPFYQKLLAEKKDLIPVTVEGEEET